MSGGRVYGARPGGTPEATKSKREKLDAGSGLHAGPSIGALPVEGDAEVGEVSLPVGGAARGAVQHMAEEMKNEPLPVEHREQIRRFHEIVLEAGGEEADGTEEEGR